MRQPRQQWALEIEVSNFAATYLFENVPLYIFILLKTLISVANLYVIS